MEGKIKMIASRGFGFIETKDKIDFFFHHSAFDGDWKKLVAQYVNNKNSGISVEFDTDETATSGPRAINVRVISGGHND